MKHLITTLVVLGITHLALGGEDKILPVTIDISQKTPIDLQDALALRTYAENYDYYYTVQLKEGMRVLYSASYGVGGEAGQGAGVIIKKDGHFWFQQKKNPTMQLLLPPGFAHSSSAEHSLWDIESYMDLVNRVVFNDPNQASHTAFKIYTNKPDAALVTFTGGTAGSTVTYKDALEVHYNHSVGSRSNSDLKVYYARGIGPVALEFRESMSPSGTFKFYLGE